MPRWGWYVVLALDVGFAVWAAYIGWGFGACLAAGGVAWVGWNLGWPGKDF